MSEVFIKKESEEDDEENGRTTPKRKSIQDCEGAEISGGHDGVIIKQGTPVTSCLFVIKGESNEDDSEKCARTLTTGDGDGTASTSGVSLAEPRSAIVNEVERQTIATDALGGVLIKNERPEPDTVGLKNTTTNLDNQYDDNENKTDASSLPPAPTISNSPLLQAAVTTELQESLDSVKNISTTVTTGVVKKEVPDVTMQTSGLSDISGKNDILETQTSAAPQIFLVPTQRLRVKAEFSETAVLENHHPSISQDYFEDLLPVNAPSPPRISDDPIPDKFFDDILVDKVKERIEEAETVELEEKYSYRLKELEELEQKSRSRERKKHKKSKKKSGKRSRDQVSRSLTPEYKRVRVEDLPSTSAAARLHRATEDDETGRHLSRENIAPMMIEDIELVDGASDFVELQPHLPEICASLTANQKIDRILVRAKSLLSYLKRLEVEEDKPFLTFLFTSTVRKLPASHSYRSQQIYENRSPLHTTKNVSYKFNSHSSKFNFEEWGLASLPPISAKIAKLVGYDAISVHNKLKVMKIPAKIRNLKSDGQNEEDEEYPQLRSSLFCNATTQTDEMVEGVPRKSNGYDIGVQAQPAAFEVACQTLETESPSINKFDNSDDLPIMTIIRELNENQLMALHDFSELIKEPVSNAMDMYRLRQRMLDIYKCSQLPSALGTTPPASMNSYMSIGSPSTQTARSQQQEASFKIQTVCTADGQRLSANDTRNQFTGNRNRDTEVIRNVYPAPQTPQRYDSRYSIDSQRASGTSSESHRQYGNETHQQQRNQMPVRGSRYYGRGGLRR